MLSQETRINAEQARSSNNVPHTYLLRLAAPNRLLLTRAMTLLSLILGFIGLLLTAVARFLPSTFIRLLLPITLRCLPTSFFILLFTF